MNIIDWYAHNVEVAHTYKKTQLKNGAMIHPTGGCAFVFNIKQRDNQSFLVAKGQITHEIARGKYSWKRNNEILLPIGKQAALLNEIKKWTAEEGMFEGLKPSQLCVHTSFRPSNSRKHFLILEEDFAGARIAPTYYIKEGKTSSLKFQRMGSEVELSSTTGKTETKVYTITTFGKKVTDVVVHRNGPIKIGQGEFSNAEDMLIHIVRAAYTSTYYYDENHFMVPQIKVSNSQLVTSQLWQFGKKVAEFRGEGWQIPAPRLHLRNKTSSGKS
jgi:hypothetical protein